MRRSRITHKQTFGRLIRANITAYPADKTHLRYQLLFSGQGQREEIEFSTPVEDGMAIMAFLQKLQAEHGFPMPPKPRPSGPVQLRLVDPDESQP
jgi:hypothetical protein